MKRGVEGKVYMWACMYSSFYAAPCPPDSPQPKPKQFLAPLLPNHWQYLEPPLGRAFQGPRGRHLGMRAGKQKELGVG